MIYEKIENLPDKIREAYGNKKRLNGRFLFSFKTLYKPNATIPILWFTLLTDGIIFLNTHKTRGAYKEVVFPEINSIKLKDFSSSENLLIIVSNDIYEEDFAMEIPKEIDLDYLKRQMESVGIQVIL